jgi:adenosylcobinamide-phosphate synthase
MVAALTMLIALAVDRLWGEPPVRWHPVVWMGNYLQTAGAWVQQRARQSTPAPDYMAFWLGALVWIAGAAMVSGVAWALQWALVSPQLALPWWAQAVVLGLFLKPLLAWNLLQSEVRAVEIALGQSLQAGRERLRWLVSRDVAQLTQEEVRESAIETLAENLNDSVVAPLFWFVLLGLPGAALYRFANTADAMWGYLGHYQGRNWEWAGKWAARADDVLGWLPARITGVLLLLLVLGGSVTSVWTRLGQLRREAAQTPSPNSGWPMAAMALNLGVALRKPGGYTLNRAGRAPAPHDTALALRYASKALLALVLCAQAAIIFIAIRGWV